MLNGSDDVYRHFALFYDTVPRSEPLRLSIGSATKGLDDDGRQTISVYYICYQAYHADYLDKVI